MTVTFKTNSLIRQLALAAAFLALGAAFVKVVFQHYLIRTIADRRIVMNREAAMAVVGRLPHSPRALFRLAEAEMAEPAFDSQLSASAQAHAALAIQNSPWDYRPWKLLAAVQESDGRPEEAEKSLLAAARLAPNNTEVRWTLANHLLRQGKLDESLNEFKLAAKGSTELFPIAFDLLWQASNGELELLKTVAGNEPKSQLSLVQFLAEQSQTELAISLYRGIDAGEKLKSPSAAAFISFLIQTKQVLTARDLWVETVGSLTGHSSADLIWNGGFEIDSRKEFDQFDWTLAPSNYARIGFDQSVSHGGGKSLKLIFAGRDTTKLEGEVKQLVALKPNTHYRLECQVKTADLMTPEGPRLALLSQNQITVISKPIAAGTSEWQRLEGEFISPAQPAATYITIARLPRFSYDDPTRGTIWFDDFKLTEL